MRLCIADPPYPPSYGERFDLADGSARLVMRSRAMRYYGVGIGTADEHPDAAEWDDPARHRALLAELADTYDGWAIATCPDGLEAYGPLPAAARIMAWVKPRGVASSSRIAHHWEPVIVCPPPARRSNRRVDAAHRLHVPDVLTCSPDRIGFVGAKPERWTRWVLDALGHEQGDTVHDMFPGSGSVTRALEQGVLL
jgi:hypothetical protein